VARRRHRQHTREFKLTALARMDTAPDVRALAQELDIERALLYRWQRHYIRGGAEALRNSGRPRPVLMRPSAAVASADERAAGLANPVSPVSAEEQAASPVMAPPRSRPLPSLAAHDPAAAAGRIAELERKIGQQQLELDFFRAALRHVGALRR
jgi:transposase-like protein